MSCVYIFIETKTTPNKQTNDFPSYEENVYSYTYGNMAMIVLNSNYWYSPALSKDTSTSGNLHGYIMDNQGQNIFQKDIEAKFHLSGATVTNMLKSLEKNGYIVRTPMENDARLKRIELTQKALDHENRVRENIMVIEEAMHEGFSKEEFNMMLGFLDRVIDNMEKLNK